MTAFSDRLKGALYGIAIGDAMGAPVEGWPSDQILEAFPDHDFSEFLPVTHGGDPASGKGDGRITDDTLMTEALIRAYGRCGDHLDAYGFRDYFVPEFTQVEVWVPERCKKMVLLERLNPIERYTVARLMSFGAYPRHAGIGNSIDCGVAMYIMPVGAVNAGDPSSAFAEAISLAMTETDSYAVEAAGVLAAAYAEAFAEDASVDQVCARAQKSARDGTGEAIVAVLAAASPEADLRTFIEQVRQAFIPYDPQTNGTAGDTSLANAHQPSRLLSIEEVPVALAALKYGAGDFLKTVRAAVCYGRDCDSIAGMACGLYGAIFGDRAIPRSLCDACDRANRRNFAELASLFEETIRHIHSDEVEVFDRKKRSLV